MTCSYGTSGEGASSVKPGDLSVLAEENRILRHRLEEIQRALGDWPQDADDGPITREWLESKGFVAETSRSCCMAMDGIVLNQSGDGLTWGLRFYGGTEMRTRRHLWLLVTWYKMGR